MAYQRALACFERHMLFAAAIAHNRSLLFQTAAQSSVNQISCKGYALRAVIQLLEIKLPDRPSVPESKPQMGRYIKATIISLGQKNGLHNLPCDFVRRQHRSRKPPGPTSANSWVSGSCVPDSSDGLLSDTITIRNDAFSSRAFRSRNSESQCAIAEQIDRALRRGYSSCVCIIEYVTLGKENPPWLLSKKPGLRLHWQS